MRIIKYEFHDIEEDGWIFSEVSFERINLLVGDSGMGKTRLLNTLFNIGSYVMAKKINPGSWNLIVEEGEKKYEWKIEATKDKKNRAKIVNESLIDITNNEKIQIIKRDRDNFEFKENSLPKLSPIETGISILKEEDDIAPLYNGFGKIMRRKFFEAELGESCNLRGYPFGNLSEIGQLSEEDIYRLYGANEFNLNGMLYILKNFYQEKYLEICNFYKDVFPFITEIDVRDIVDIQDADNTKKFPGQAPVFSIKEKNVTKWITLDNLSSGMQKVLLILTDIYTIPKGGIYLIDEYENSLGISAINFFPSLLLDSEFVIQFIITSHHPYIINNIPVKNWFVFHRIGSDVKIKFGKELEDKFGKSKQQAFIQLLNDPFYIEGKE